MRRLILLMLALVTNIALASAPYTFAIPLHPWRANQTNANIMQSYQPLARYLTKQLHHKVELRGYQSNKDIVTALANGELSFALVKVSAYLDAHAINEKVHPIVTVLTWNQAHTKKICDYNSYIITLKKRHNIHSVFDLHGKTFGFVDHYSASGFIYPIVYMKQHGIDYRTFLKHYAFLGNHEAVLYAVAQGKVSAGAVWDAALDDAPNRKVYKIIGRITHVPNPLYAASSTLPVAVVHKMQQVLAKAPMRVIKGLAYVGFQATPKAFYANEAVIYHLLKP